MATSDVHHMVAYGTGVSYDGVPVYHMVVYWCTSIFMQFLNQYFYMFVQSSNDNTSLNLNENTTHSTHHGARYCATSVWSAHVL